MTAKQRKNRMADELFQLVERPAGYAHISDGIGNLDDGALLSLAEKARDQHAHCVELLNKFIYHHAKRVVLKRPYTPMKLSASRICVGRENKMPICEAIIHVECDKCQYVSDPMNLTSLAGGGWDARNIPKRLERDGWKVEGSTTICPECVEGMQAASLDPT